MIDYSGANYEFKYILNVIDYQYKILRFLPCLNKTANEVYFHLEPLSLNCVIPKEI